MSDCVSVQLGGNPKEKIYKQNDIVNNLFKNVIGKKPVIVLYFADWCGHCKNLKPTWHQTMNNLPLKQIINPKKEVPNFEKYVIALEADAYDKNNCPNVDQNVQGFPTINYYPPKKAPLEAYDDERDEEHMKKWISDKLDLGSVQSIPQDGGSRGGANQPITPPTPPQPPRLRRTHTICHGDRCFCTRICEEPCPDHAIPALRPDEPGYGVGIEYGVHNIAGKSRKSKKRKKSRKSKKRKSKRKKSRKPKRKKSRKSKKRRRRKR